MFKNLKIFQYELTEGAAFPSINDIELLMGEGVFTPCEPSQAKSSGWIEPRSEPNGRLVEIVGGQVILKFRMETKVVPARIIQRHLQAKVKVIEEQTGRKPGKKEIREIKEAIAQEQIVYAFPKELDIFVWIDRETQMIGIDACVNSKLDVVMSQLVNILPGVSFSHLNSQVSPEKAMAHWLSTQEPPYHFTIDRNCELKACDESKASVRYGNHRLDMEEVTQHIQGGKVPTKLSLTWNDRLSFVLDSNYNIQRIEFLDLVFEGKSGDEPDKFDADVFMCTQEFKNMIPDLILALGGDDAVVE